MTTTETNIILSLLDGCPLDKLASQMDISPSTLRVHLSNIRKQLEPRKNHRPLSPLMERVVKLRDSGMTHAQIAQKLNISPANSGMILMRAKQALASGRTLNPLPTPAPAGKIDWEAANAGTAAQRRVAPIVKQGLSVAQIAKQLKISESTVSQIVDGLPRIAAKTSEI